MKMEAGLFFERTDNYTNTFTAIINATNPFDSDLIKHFKENNTTSIASSINGGFVTKFKIGPEFSFKIYDVLGPYFYLPLKMDVKMKANTVLNWQGSAGIGFEGNIGVKGEVDPVKIFKWQIIDGFVPFDFSHDFFGDKYIDEYKWPSKLELISGNFQQGKANTKLANPINFKVLSSNGVGVPLVPVRFELEDGNGSVNKNLAFTDISGQVSIDWTLGTNSKSILKAYVLDYQNINIENSPIYVTAYVEGVSTTCENSNLAISIKTADTYKYPSVSGGTAPYLYSTNAFTYSPTLPHFSLSVPGNFIVFVRDKNGCSVTKSFTITAPNACTNSDLTMDITVLANILKITGKGGILPYQYAIDNNTSFSTVNTYSNLTAGVHTIYVKDANGCIISSEVKIGANTQAAIKATYPANGASYIPISGLTFQWAAATYTSNQRYDLYLKKGTDAYTLIASNLNPTSFTYNTALIASTAYTWKVDVKSAGAVLDYSEFTFTTASGVTTAPTVPAVLLQPASGATVYPLVTFRWTPQAGDFKYDLYLDTNNATSLVALNLINPECTVKNLVSGKTYYWRVKTKSTITGAYATSEVRSFTVLNTGNTVTDIDGNVYHTVTIGTQTWMVENLKTTRYRNGDPITEQWAYNNDANNAAKYGRLYTWYAATDSRGIAPAGWHVPTDAEWTTLENYLIANGYNYDGTTTGNKIAKALAATTDWNTDNGSGTIGNDLTKNNSSGFTALPGGSRSGGGAFNDVGVGYWWSSTEATTAGAWGRGLYYYDDGLGRGFSTKSLGFSVRCIKDETINPLNIETALIPAGTFTMGSPETELGRNSNETQHQVTLSAFRMSKYEITNAQYAAFLNTKGIGSDGLYAAGAYPTQKLINAYTKFGLIYSGSQWMPVVGYENYPVVWVTWYGATEFATYVGGSLPTESQWEYACRAGTIKPFNTGECLTNLQANYYWSSSPYSTCTNTVTTYPGKTQAVGSYAPNGYGLFDMHGNVWEWCSDWYGTYPTTTQNNPTGAATGSYRVRRSGAWYSGVQNCRSAIRGVFIPTETGHVGFRVVFVP